MSKKFALLTAIGTLLLFSGVTFAERYLFKPPVNLGPPVNTEWFEGDPFITADSQKLFFVSDRQEPHTNTDIYMSVWIDSGWSIPVNLGPNINDINLDEWSPSLSPDDEKLYFSAFGRPGSQGGWDLWESTFDSALNEWGPAQNMGSVINTFAVDWLSEISRDGQSLYYASNGFGHGCGQALYVSHWNGSSWDIPEPFPLIVHETCTEERPSLLADEKTMYFVRWDNVPTIYVTKRTSPTSDDWSKPVRLDTLINYNGLYGTSGPCVTANGQVLYFGSWRPDSLDPFNNSDIWTAVKTIPGDLNLDGEITSADVVLELYKVFLDQPIPAPDAAADLDCDANFSPSDVVLLLLRTFLNVPFPC